jgi:hypothetical protein
MPTGDYLRSGKMGCACITEGASGLWEGKKETCGFLMCLSHISEGAPGLGEGKKETRSFLTCLGLCKIGDASAFMIKERRALR